MTCFGTYQPFNDTTWADLPIPWKSFTGSWNNGSLQSDFPLIVAGNQQGFVFKNYNYGNILNSPSLFISAVTQANPGVITSPNHNMSTGTIIKITGAVGMTQLNGNIYRVSNPTQNTFVIETLDANGNWIKVDTTAFGVYVGSGVITIRNNFNVTTKRFNPILETAQQIRVGNIDLFLQATTSSEFTLNIYANENPNTPVEIDLFSANSVTGEDKVWTRVYTSTIGQFIQVELTFSDAQMVDETKSDSDFVLHAMIPWFAPAGRLTFGTTI
jgi:hypothetical protein